MKDKQAQVMHISAGLLVEAEYIATSHCDHRPADTNISLLVIHNISLPPNQFGGPYISELFLGQLDPQRHPYFAQIYQLRVSSHCLIRRDGQIIQYVPFHLRAWHAGVSSFQGKASCNDYSIGIELEGADHIPYTSDQYKALVRLSWNIMQDYQGITLGRIVGHNDIAPGRKTDPGIAFNWAKFRTNLASFGNNHQ